MEWEMCQYLSQWELNIQCRPSHPVSKSSAKTLLVLVLTLHTVMFGPGRDECRLKRLLWVSDEHVGQVLVQLVDVFLVAEPARRCSEGGSASNS